MFIYKIKNTSNQKVYVGKTTKRKAEIRFRQHKSDLNNLKHFNKHLQAAWNKYGETSFVFEVIEQFDSSMNFDLDKLERYWIKFYDSMNPTKGYNKTYGGEGGTGYKHTQEHKDYISNKLSGRIFTEKTKEKMSLNHHSKNENYISAWLGKKHSIETRNKISASLSKLVGDKSPRSKKVICTLSGRIFGCAKDAAVFLNMKYDTLKAMLNGGNPNKTTFKYLEV